ncbi:MAG: hypothetical protein MJ061_02305 [Mailhella sp.]|nr:hypothetical protein [Mailhella sp.]
MDLLEKERLERLRRVDPERHAAEVERLRLMRERRRTMPRWRRVLDIIVHGA